ncbi:MAG: hypothetical protein ACKVJK_20195, partial [Methylophagaceae bacterium]
HTLQYDILGKDMAIISAQVKTTNTDILDPTGVGSPAGAVPTGKTYAITNMIICNNSTSAAATLDIHLVKSGTALSNAVTRIAHDLSLPAKETFTFDTEKIILDQGDKIVLIGSPDIGAGLSNLSATVSYLEV